MSDSNREKCSVLNCERIATHVRNAAVPSKICCHHAWEKDRPIDADARQTEGSE